LQDAEANKMEAKWHDLVFDVNDEDNNFINEARNHEVAPPQIDDDDATRKSHNDEGSDFEQIIQAQKAITRICTGVHEFNSNEDWMKKKSMPDSRLCGAQ